MSKDPCKVVLLGESGVGKTSIISQFIEQEFFDFQTSTTGATFSTKTIKVDKYNETLVLEIWDTAGQERFRSMSKIFYKEASIAILVYDITKQNSFNEVKDYWVDAVNQFAPQDVVLGIAANKSDLIENEEVNENEARKLAESIQAVFMPTSAKNSNGIDELFMELGERYFERKMKSNKEDNKGGKKKLEKGKDGKEKGKCCS
jgi:small GTP-binding protein